LVTEIERLEQIQFVGCFEEREQRPVAGDAEFRVTIR
jgi:hypothetical protein